MSAMASMYEIYQKHRTEYDQLIAAEDFPKALPSFLQAAIDWQEKTVLEGGTGTGRLTELYAAGTRHITCLDLEPHMLEAAEERLSAYAGKITFQAADNLDLPPLPEKADIFIEGWSWGHSVVDHPDTVESITAKLFENIQNNLIPGAEVILIETMGTNQAKPSAPLPRLKEFYTLLEETYGMKGMVLTTDYLFPSVEEAADTLGFFFGDEMKHNILQANSRLIPEWTCIWTGCLPHAK